jgi:hypothetical protein
MTINGSDLPAIIIACGTLITAVLQAYNTMNMRRLEKNTNSIKDALVLRTAEASESKGHAAGLEQGRNERFPK